MAPLLALILIALLVFVILAGVVLLIILYRRRLGFGSLSAPRIYQDTPTQPGELLSATSLPLCGKPDYLIKSAGGIIPVEYKARSSAPSYPYPSHVFQLLAYCLLVTEHYGTRPSHGVLKYQDREFRIPYSTAAEEELRQIVLEMVRYKTTPATLRFSRKFLCVSCRKELGLDRVSRK